MFFEWLNDKLPLPAVLLLFPVVFMVHDFEEILTVEKWTKQNKEKVFALLPKKLHRFFWSSFHINTLEFAKDVFWIFLAVTAAALIAVLFQWYGFFLIFLAIFFFPCIYPFRPVGPFQRVCARRMDFPFPRFALFPVCLLSPAA